MSSKKTNSEVIQKKKIRKAVNNKKHRNNKILKAKEILAKNKAALEARSQKRSVAEKRSVPLRLLGIAKKILLSLLIITFAVVIISFVVVRFNGDTPVFFGYSVQRIVSSSMEPALSVGDIILCKSVSDPSEIVYGDIITYKGGPEFDNHNITHRVVTAPFTNAAGEYVLSTKGDANDIPDKEITFSSVISKYVNRIDFLNKFYEFFLSPWGLIIFIAALLIIFFDELLTLVKVMAGNNKEDESEHEDEDENVREIMERLKREEEEEKLRLEAEKERKRRISEKYGSTSKKKQKAQKQQRSKDKKQERTRNTQPQYNDNKNNRKKNQSRKKHKMSKK